MDKAEVAGALQEYEDALTEFLTSVRARDGPFRFSIEAAAVYMAGIEIERLKLRGTCKVPHPDA